jgi:predicted nucleic acid-binding protein
VSLPRAVLDADIIFSRVLHELMGRLAGSVRLFDLIWSEELLDEVKSSLIERKGLSVEVAEAWVGHMRREFPDGSVDLSAVPDDLDLTSLTRDLDDVHVCALAIAGNADYLFTFDRGYLKKPLQLHGVEVPNLDQFLVKQREDQPEAFRRIVESQAEAWRDGRPVSELLAAFKRANVPKFAAALDPRIDDLAE